MSSWALDYVPKVKPGPHGQEAFHLDRHRKRYRALYAGTGGGKTYAAVAEDLAVCVMEPGVKGIVAGPDFPSVRGALYPVFERHLGTKEPDWSSHPLVSSWNRTEHVLRFRNGSQVEFMGLVEEEGSEGQTVNFVHVTEPRLVRRWGPTWLALKRRLRRQGFQGGWVDTHSPTKELVEEFESGDPRYGVYRWTTEDAFKAGVISEGFYLDMVQSHHGARAKAVLEGLFARPEGVVYDLFDPSRHVRPAPDKPLNERKAPYEPWSQAVSYGVDWGYTHAAVITVWGWNGSKCQGLEEYWARFRTTPQLLEEAKRLRDKWGDGPFFCGADEPQSVQQFRDAGLDAQILPQEKRKVRDGCAQINAMWGSDELHVDPQMTHFRDEIDQYALRHDSDEPEKDAPDAMDSARYGIFGFARSRAPEPNVVRKPTSRAPRNVAPGALYGIKER